MLIMNQKPSFACMNALNPHNNLNEVSSIIVIIFYRGGKGHREVNPKIIHSK